MKRILVGVDGSDPALRAVDLAVDLAARYGAEILLVSVMQERVTVDPTLQDFARLEGFPGAPFEVLRAFGTKALLDAEARVGAAGVTRLASEIASGDPPASSPATPWWAMSAAAPSSSSTT